MINVTTAPDEEKFLQSTKIRVFLAGGITNCYDWQQETIENLNAELILNDINITIFNPRRYDWENSIKTTVLEKSIN